MKTIRINENSTFPLPDIEVGRASAFNCTLTNIDRTYTNVQISVGQISAKDACLPCPCTESPGGEWRAYISGAFFLAVGTSCYHVTAKTAKGDCIYLGGGRLIITPSVLNVEPAEMPVMPDEVYVRGSTGLYYRVTVELDEDGVPYMIVDPNGVTK